MAISRSRNCELRSAPDSWWALNYLLVLTLNRYCHIRKISLGLATSKDVQKEHGKSIPSKINPKHGTTISVGPELHPTPTLPTLRRTRANGTDTTKTEGFASRHARSSYRSCFISSRSIAHTALQLRVRIQDISNTITALRSRGGAKRVGNIKRNIREGKE